MVKHKFLKMKNNTKNTKIITRFHNKKSCSTIIRQLFHRCSTINKNYCQKIDVYSFFYYLYLVRKMIRLGFPCSNIINRAYLLQVFLQHNNDNSWRPYLIKKIINNKTTEYAHLRPFKPKTIRGQPNLPKQARYLSKMPTQTK